MPPRQRRAPAAAAEDPAAPDDGAHAPPAGSSLLARLVALELGPLVIAAAAACAVACLAVVLLAVKCDPPPTPTRRVCRLTRGVARSTVRFFVYLELLRQAAAPRDLVNAGGALVLLASIVWRDRQYLTVAVAACGWLAALEALGHDDEGALPADGEG